MVNGLGVLGYGVGGIEAEAVLLGQPLYQPMPHVVGVRLHGALPRGSTATDLVLVVTEMLRAHGVVGAFVEFAGDGLATLALADRTTISNMSPEFGATATLFPIDDETLTYLRLTGRSPERVDLVERYAKAQGLWREPGDGPAFDELLELDLASVAPSVAGPRRPQDRVPLETLRDNFRSNFPNGLEANARRARRRGAGPRQRGRRGRLGRIVPGIGSAVVRVGRCGRGCRPTRGTGRSGCSTRRRARLSPGRPRDRRTAVRGADRVRRHRGDHVLHQHVQSDRDGRGRPAGPQRGRPRPARRADGQDLAGARLARGDRLSRGGRADGAARGARVRPGRLRLHDLHRQLRATRRGGRRRGRGERPGRRRGPVREPQLRGPDPPAGAGELPRLTAARRRLRAGRPGRHRPDHRAARDGQRRAAGLPRRHLAGAGRDPLGHRRRHRP